jgi:hypothetical protein
MECSLLLVWMGECGFGGVKEEEDEEEDGGSDHHPRNT